jgi:hypothetical protein
MNAAAEAEAEKAATLGNDMKRTYNYVWPRGVLLIIFAHPVYEALVGLRAYVAEEGKGGNGRVIDLPFKVPFPLLPIPSFAMFVTIFRVQVIAADGQFEFYLRPWRWLEYLMAKLPGGRQAVSLPLSAVGGWLLRRKGRPDEAPRFAAADRAKFFLLILLLWVATLLLAIPANFVYSLEWALFRGIALTMRSALRPIPALLAVLFVVFATGDSWRIFGEEPYWRFSALIIILVVVGLVAMTVNLLGVKDGWHSILQREATGDQVLREWAEQTPAKRLCSTLNPVSPFEKSLHRPRGQQPPADMPRALTIVRQLLSKNIAVVFWLTMALNVIAVAFWISLLFVAVGTVAISYAMTNDLLNSTPEHPAAITVTHFGLLGQQFYITRQLILLSVVLGAIAALNFATSTLQNADNLETFADHALQDLRHALAALAYYLGAVEDLLVQLKADGAINRLKEIDATTIAKFLDSLHRTGDGMPADAPGLIIQASAEVFGTHRA